MPSDERQGNSQATSCFSISMYVSPVFFAYVSPQKHIQNVYYVYIEIHIHIYVCICT